MQTILLLTVVAGLGWLIYRGEKIMSAVDNLENKVAGNTDAVQSAVTLLGNLKTALDEAIASGDMGRVQELSDRIGNNTDSLAAAVVANTPAAPNA